MLIEEILSEIRIEPYPLESHFDPGFEEGPALVGTFKTSAGDTVECFIFYKESEDAVLINFKRDGETRATGKGDQFKIFGTAMEFFQKNIHKMIKKFNPPRFIFRVNNAEQSRVNLYRRRFAPELTKTLGPNWNGPKEETRQDGSISGTYFIWELSNSQETPNDNEKMNQELSPND